MIKRILTTEDFNEACHHLTIKFSQELGDYHHFLSHDTEKMTKRFCNRHVLQNQFFVWANKEDGVYDSCIAFTLEDSKYNETVFVEYLWISKNPKVGFKLFRKATAFARDIGIKYIVMANTEKGKQKKKLESFYEKMGLLKDSTLYIAKL